jgi:hypothetical protein
MKSGNRNFLEPSGPLQACKGTALPFNILCEAVHTVLNEYFLNVVSFTLELALQNLVYIFLCKSRREVISIAKFKFIVEMSVFLKKQDFFPHFA